MNVVFWRKDSGEGISGESDTYKVLITHLASFGLPRPSWARIPIGNLSQRVVILSSFSLRFTQSSTTGTTFPACREPLQPH